MPLPEGWLHVGRDGRPNTGRPCAVCGHADFCTESVDGTVAHCQRVSRGAFKASRKRGWFHRIAEGQTPPAPRHVATRRAASPATSPARDFTALARRWTGWMTTDRYAQIGRALGGISAGTLKRLGTGWAPAAELREAGTKCRARGCWTFPMSDGAGRVVGVRLRTPDGFKYAVAGSDGTGIFVPADLDARKRVLLPEGPTSLAAVLELGLEGVGRPSNFAGVEHLSAMFAACGARAVVVVGDNDRYDRGLGDRPGHAGAWQTARELGARGVAAAVMFPPAGFKDVRDWYLAGARAADVRRLARDATGVRKTTTREENAA